MMRLPVHFRVLLLAAVALAMIAAPAFAATSGPPAVAPLFGKYWDDFLEHWGNVFKKQNGVIMFVLGMGAVSLFIITRGKWKK